MQFADIECRLTAAAVDDLLTDEHVLAVVSHGNPCRPTGTPRHFESGLPMLGGDGANEVWRSATPVRHGTERGCDWAESDSVLFAALWLKDAEGQALIDGVRRAYEQLPALARSRGYPHLVRVWNYINDINRGDGDDERYKLFCRGRHEALSETGYAAGDYPAASALGHHSGGTIVYLLAARSPCRHFENPQQTSAYHYPRRYGPRSPSFARATAQHRRDGGGTVYLSGTASIVGHQTRHPDDLEGQIRVTLDNLDALTDSIRARTAPGATLRPSVLKVYLRRAADQATVQRRIERHYGPDPQVVYLGADICRRELLTEIEGVCVF